MNRFFDNYDIVLRKLMFCNESINFGFKLHKVLYCIWKWLKFIQLLLWPNINIFDRIMRSLTLNCLNGIIKRLLRFTESKLLPLRSFWSWFIDLIYLRLVIKMQRYNLLWIFNLNSKLIEWLYISLQIFTYSYWLTFFCLHTIFFFLIKVLSLITNRTLIFCDVFHQFNFFVNFTLVLFL